MHQSLEITREIHSDFLHMVSMSHGVVARDTSFSWWRKSPQMALAESSFPKITANDDPQTMTTADPGAQRRHAPPTVTAIAGGLAGLISRFVIAPLDVIKIRLQLQSRTAATYRGAIHAAQTIIENEGITALWKGNIPAELLYVSYSMVQFVAYREAHVLLEGMHMENRYRSFLAGAMAGTSATLVTYPLDLLRTRFAAQGTTKVCIFLFQRQLIVDLQFCETFDTGDPSRRRITRVLSRSINLGRSNCSLYGHLIRDLRGYSHCIYTVQLISSTNF